MNLTQSQNSSPTAEKILEGVAKGTWKKEGYEGEPPALTLDELREWMPPLDMQKMFYWTNRSGPIIDVQGALDELKAMEIPTDWQDQFWYYLELCKFQHSIDVPMRTRTVDKTVTETFPDTELTVEWTVPRQEVTNPSEIKPRTIASYAAMAFMCGWNDEPNLQRHKELHGISSIADGIQAIYQLWNEVNKKHPSEIRFPLIPPVEAWLTEQTHRTIKNATVAHVQDLTTIPYAVSEVNRRKWEPVGSVDAIAVDGEPIITQMKQLPGPFSDDYPEKAKVYKPKGTQGELMPMPKQRDNMDTPIPLVAYQKWGKNLRSALASDVAQLMSLAYTANEPLILSVKDGARLLARAQDGQLRKPQPPDEQRFENAFACVHGMSGWITDKRGINRFYPLTACDRFSDNRVSIAAASWARDRKAGRWTLTAGFGVAGQNRLKGNAHNNNVWRVITGVEYWLARERFAPRGTHKGISQALIPADGRTGPGNWHTLTWKELMMIAGDVWDWNDKDANWRVYRRFNKIKQSLIQHGYQVKNLNRAAEAGDTVEFLFGKRKDGNLKVRATERFVEGARKAKKQDWQTVNLSDFLGYK